MHAWTDCCLCVCLSLSLSLSLSLCGSVDLFAGWSSLHFTDVEEGTFTNCNFTSNSADDVSLEEEYVDDSEIYMFC